MKKLENYILEKLKIGKNNTKNKNIINIDIDTKTMNWTNDCLGDYYSDEDLENIIDFAENLEKRPVMISNKDDNANIYDRIVLLFFCEDIYKERAIIRHNDKYENSYTIKGMYNKEVVFERMVNKPLKDVLDVLDSELEKHQFYKNLSK